MKRTFFKPSLAQKIRANQAALDLYASASDKPKMDIGAKPKQVRRAPERSEKPLEKDIQAAILQYLRLHPKIAFVGRFNSGAIQGEHNGQTRFIQFNSIRGFPDIHGMLRGGKALYIEVKRPGGKPTTDQEQFMNHATKHGAAGLIAYSLEDVIEFIKRC